MKRQLVILLALLTLAAAIFWRYAPNKAPAGAEEPTIDGSENEKASVIRAMGSNTAFTSRATNVARVNAVDSDGSTQREQSIEVDNYSAGSSRYQITKAEYDHRRDEDARRIQRSVDADIAAGINTEVRQREAELRQRAGNLVAGMNRATVLQLLGPPSEVKVERDEPSFPAPGSIVQTNAEGHAILAPGPVRAIIFKYPPCDGVSFDLRNGWGYQVLFLRFDDTGGWLARWQWEGETIRFSDEKRQWQKWEDYARAAALK